MAQGKQNARQKMINLMYLIFIAMLALNVDREVLRSFEKINNTLETTTGLTVQNNKTFYDNIDRKAKDDPDYVSVKTDADKVKMATAEFVNYIQGLKNELAKHGEYAKVKEGEETNYNALQNTEPIVQLFFKGEGGENGNKKAQDFTQKIEGFKKFLLTYAKEKIDQDRINQFFDTSKTKGSLKSWVGENYYEQPMVAAMTNFSKIQADAVTEEGNLVRKLFAQKLMQDIELKAFQPIVMVPPFVRAGEVVEGKIAFGAFDNTLQGSVTVNGQTVELKDGVAQFNVDSGSPGKRTVSGTMTYKDADGKDVKMDYSQEYEVVSETIVKPPSGAVITADKMNVVYRYLDNPITATVNGADGAISLTASMPGLSGSNGKYNFKPTAGSGTVKFTASAKTSTGKTVSGSQEFRIKPVPPARGVILGKTNITVPANGIAAQTVKVDWPDFLFDMSATVTSFKVKVAGQPTASVNGTSMGGAAGVLSKARKGDAVFVFEIKYKSTTGITGEASPITIEVR